MPARGRGLRRLPCSQLRRPTHRGLVPVCLQAQGRPGALRGGDELTDPHLGVTERLATYKHASVRPAASPSSRITRWRTGCCRTAHHPVGTLPMSNEKERGEALRGAQRHEAQSAKAAMRSGVF